MRVAILHPRLTSRGGAEKVMVWLANGLAGRGHEVHIISRHFDPGLWEDQRHPNLYWHSLPNRITSRLGHGLESRAAAKVILGIRPRVDLACASNFPSYWWLEAAQRQADDLFPSMWYCHEPNRSTYVSVTDNRTLGYLRAGIPKLPNHHHLAQLMRKRRQQERLRRYFRRARDRKAVAAMGAILANSRYTADKIKAIWDRSAFVCYPGIPPRTDEEPKAVSQRKNLIYLSSFDMRKNVIGVLAAFSLVVNNHNRKDIILNLVGSEKHDVVLDYIHDHHLSDYVRLHGFLREKEKFNLLASSRLCVFVPFCEPFGLVTLEALQHGTPVIAADHGGQAEVVTNGTTGVLVDPYDPQSIADGILSVYDDLPRLQAMSRAGMDLVKPRFLVSRFVRDFEKKALELVESLSE